MFASFKHWFELCCNHWCIYLACNDYGPWPRIIWPELWPPISDKHCSISWMAGGISDIYDLRVIVVGYAHVFCLKPSFFVITIPMGSKSQKWSCFNSLVKKHHPWFWLKFLRLSIHKKSLKSPPNWRVFFGLRTPPMVSDLDAARVAHCRQVLEVRRKHPVIWPSVGLMDDLILWPNVIKCL